MKKMLCLLYSLLFIATCAADVKEDHGFINKTITEFVKSQIKLLDDYQHTFPDFSRTEINSLIWTVQKVLEKLKESQKEAYLKIIPNNKCPIPLVPQNGGLVCVHLESVHYCKPMCDKGYDFSFLRRSRVYEECGEHTGYSWTTQYVGGQKLADCIATLQAVSGVSTAYFPGDRKCQEIITRDDFEQNYIETFLLELKDKNIEKGHKKHLDFVVCGE